MLGTTPDQGDAEEDNGGRDARADPERFGEDQRSENHRDDRVDVRIQRDGGHRQVLQRVEVSRVGNDGPDEDEIRERRRRTGAECDAMSLARE